MPFPNQYGYSIGFEIWHSQIYDAVPIEVSRCYIIGLDAHCDRRPEACAKPPSPLPSKMLTLSEVIFTTARSAMPSPLKS